MWPIYHKAAHLLRRLVPILFLASLSTRALAQIPATQPDDVANGTQAFQEGNYLLAIQYFQSAQAKSPDSPALLFDLGLAESQIPGRELRAICWLEAYIAAKPFAPNRAAILEQVQALDSKSRSNLSRMLQSVKDSAAHLTDDQSIDLVVGLLAETGDVADATTFTQKTSTPYWRGNCYVEIAEAQITAGDLSGAGKTLDAAQKCADQVTQNPGGHDWVQSFINSDRGNLVKELVKLGKFSAAIKISDLLPDAGAKKLWRSNAKHTIAEALAAAGSYGKAQKIANQIPDLYWKNDTLANVVKAQAAAGDIAGAIDRAKTTGEPDLATDMVVEIQAMAGDIAGAKRTTDLIQDPDVKNLAFGSIAGGELKAGDTAAAKASIDAITNAGEKDDILASAAEAQAKAGNVAEALQLVDMMSARKSYEYKFIAGIQAGSGDVAGALQTASLNADAEPDQFWRSATLNDIAVAQAKSGDIGGALKTVDMIQNAGWIDSARKAVHEVQVANAPDWLAALADSSSEGALNSNVFLDLSGTLLAIPQSDDPKVLLEPVIDAAESMYRAQTAVDTMLAQVAASRKTADTYFSQGNAQYDKGDLSSAVASYTKVLSFLPTYVYAYDNRGNAQRALGKLDDAMADYLAAIELAPNDADAYRNLGLIKGSKGDFASAGAYYSRALEINPEFPDAYYNRGYARQQMGDLDGAIKDYTVAVYLNPKDFKAYTNRGSALHAKGFMEGSIADYDKAIEINPGYPNSYLGLSFVKYDQNDWDDSIAFSTKAIELVPDYGTAYTSRGNARREKGDLDGAMSDYSKAIELSSDNPANMAQAYNYRAAIKQGRGDQNGALADFSKAIEADPTFAKPHLGRGIAEQAKGDVDKAIADFADAIRLEPDLANALTQFPKILKKMIEAGTPGQNHTVTLPNAVTLDLIWIAPGTFMMGSPDLESGRKKGEGPQTAVTISKGFWLGKTLVTQGQYQAVMGSNPSNVTNVGADAPVEGVSWNDAMAFCKKLTEQKRVAGRLPEGYAYTLPTEAQWEYACRAGTTEARYGNLDDIAWYGGNSGTMHPVARKQPNAWGLYDMLGNVWEWCSDWSSTYPGGNVTDPVGPASGSYRVVRGGEWDSDAADCRSANRGGSEPGDDFDRIGFRVALSSVR